MGYGLTFANERGERAAVVRVKRREEWRTTKAADDVEDARVVEQREKEKLWAAQKAALGGNRKQNTLGHKTGKLTETERTARLVAMSVDASTHDEGRLERLRKNAVDESNRGEQSLADLATSAPSRHHSKAAPFLEQAQKDAFAFGGTKGEQSLEDRIGTTKYYSQKRGGD